MIRYQDVDEIVANQRRRWTDMERAECALIVATWMVAALLMASALLAAV